MPRHVSSSQPSRHHASRRVRCGRMIAKCFRQIGYDLTVPLLAWLTCPIRRPVRGARCAARSCVKGRDLPGIGVRANSATMAFTDNVSRTLATCPADGANPARRSPRLAPLLEPFLVAERDFGPFDNSGKSRPAAVGLQSPGQFVSEANSETGATTQPADPPVGPRCVLYVQGINAGKCRSGISYQLPGSFVVRISPMMASPVRVNVRMR